MCVSLVLSPLQCARQLVTEKAREMNRQAAALLAAILLPNAVQQASPLSSPQESCTLTAHTHRPSHVHHHATHPGQIQPQSPVLLIVPQTSPKSASLVTQSNLKQPTSHQLQNHANVHAPPIAVTAPVLALLIQNSAVHEPEVSFQASVAAEMKTPSSKRAACDIPGCSSPNPQQPIKRAQQSSECIVQRTCSRYTHT